jgi:hypothetical protein
MRLGMLCHAEMMFVLLLTSAGCTLPEVKVRGSDALKDAGRDDLAASEAGRSGRGGAGGEKAAADGGGMDAAAEGGRGGTTARGRAGSLGVAGVLGRDAAADGGGEVEVGPPNRSWVSAAQLDLGTQVKALSHRIDGEGRSLAMWQGTLGSATAIYGSRYIDSAWSHPFKVAEPSNNDAFLAVEFELDATGRAIALTRRVEPPEEPIGYSTDLYAATMSAEGAWGTEQLLGRQYLFGDARLAVNGSGAGVVAAVDLVATSNSKAWTFWTKQYNPYDGWSQARTLAEASATTSDSNARRIEAEDFPKSVAVAIDRNGVRSVASGRPSGVYASIDTIESGATQLEEQTADYV